MSKCLIHSTYAYVEICPNSVSGFSYTVCSDQNPLTHYGCFNMDSLQERQHDSMIILSIEIHFKNGSCRI